MFDDTRDRVPSEGGGNFRRYHLPLEECSVKRLDEKRKIPEYTTLIRLSLLSPISRVEVQHWNE